MTFAKPTQRPSPAPHLAASAVTGTLTVTLHDHWLNDPALEDRWESLAKRVGSDVYTAPIHARVWWKHYGRGPSFVAEATRGGSSEPRDSVAIVPMFIDRVMTPLGAAQLCRLIGGDSTITVLSPAIEPSEAEAIWTALLQELAPRCDAVCLAPMSGLDGPPMAFARAARSLGWSATFRKIGVHATYHLPASFEAYLASLDSRQRGNLRRDRNRATKGGTMRVELVTDPARLVHEFPEFMRMHAFYWHQRGKNGHFEDWPGAPAFSADLTAALAARGAAFLVNVIAGDRSVACEWCFVQGHVGCWRLPARLPECELDRMGLGRLSMTWMLEEMIRRDVRSVEAGPGHYDYKLKHGALETPLWSAWAVNRAVLPATRAQWVRWFSRACDFCYYRGWFLKLRPKLGLPRRPLARAWARLRV